MAKISNPNAADPVDTSRYSFHVNDRFYQSLLQDVPRWDKNGSPVDSAVTAECQALLFREARLIDTGQFDEWLELFASDGLYWVPHVRGGGDPRHEVSLAFDDRRRLEDRLARLRTGVAYAQIPPSRTCHLLGNLEVWDGGRPSEVLVRSTFIIYEFRTSSQRALPGWYGHRLRKQNGEWKIVLKQVNLLLSDQGLENMSFVL